VTQTQLLLVERLNQSNEFNSIQLTLTDHIYAYRDHAQQNIPSLLATTRSTIIE